MARLLDQYHVRQIAPELTEKFGVKNKMAIPKAREDRHQHGRRPRHPGQGRPGGGRRQPGTGSAARSRWSPRPRPPWPGSGSARGTRSAARSPSAAKRMYEFLDRLISIALPAYPRLPGRQPQQLRRPRQLHPGPRRAGRLPRDRGRQDPAHAGHGHHHRHLGQDDDQARELLRGVRHAVPGAGSRRGSETHPELPNSGFRLANQGSCRTPELGMSNLQPLRVRGPEASKSCRPKPR